MVSKSLCLVSCLYIQTECQHLQETFVYFNRINGFLLYWIGNRLLHGSGPWKDKDQAFC